MTTYVELSDDCPSCGEPVRDHSMQDAAECDIACWPVEQDEASRPPPDLNVGRDA